jgi:hypothetical protein
LAGVFFYFSKNVFKILERIIGKYADGVDDYDVDETTRTAAVVCWLDIDCRVLEKEPPHPKSLRGVCRVVVVVESKKKSG